MRRRRFGLILGLALAYAPGPPARADLPYESQIVGAKESTLADLLGEVSELKSLQDRPPVSAEALRGRAQRDLGRLGDAAHSLGYWGAQFSYRIDTTAKPAKVVVSVTPGPLYHVGTLDILGPDGNKLAVPGDTGALPLKPGDPARTAPVVETEQALVAALKRNGHPFAKAGHRRVVIDNSTHTMAVTYALDPGPRRNFGPTAIHGLKHLRPGYVERRIKWHQGAEYDLRQVEDTRQALIGSGLFSQVTITPQPAAGNPGAVQMKIDAAERARRTIGAGIGYNTTTGPAANAFWENRNLFGNAEKLHLDLTLGQQSSGAAARFRRPDFLATDQDLLAVAEIANDTPTAYHSRRAKVSTGLERRFGPHLTGGVALALEKANVIERANTTTFTTTGTTQHYALIGVPLYLKLDESDDLLNPTRGYRAQASLVPYRSFSGPSLSFVSGRLAASAYHRLTDSDRYVLAGMASISSIAGASLDALPADKRIYAGGGGSVRAYGYQMAGALNSNGRPIGGRSSIELSLEARIKVTDHIGIVPFLDAGSYYPGSLPSLGDRLLYGPGIGFRYYTAFGPLRLDVATPLNRRHGDSLFQIYISLGQAF